MLQTIDEKSFLFNLKSFVSTNDQAKDFLGATEVTTEVSRDDAERQDIPQVGQIQEVLAIALQENSATDIFYVNLKARTETERHICSDCTTTTTTTPAPPSDQWLQWANTPATTVDVDLFQNGTNQLVGECGQLQAKESGGTKKLEILANDCTSVLKPLCMRGSDITVTAVGSAKQKRRKNISKKKGKSLSGLTALRKWKRFFREKQRRSRDKAGKNSVSKCLRWNDLILPGDVYLGE